MYQSIPSLQTWYEITQDHSTMQKHYNINLVFSFPTKSIWNPDLQHTVISKYCPCPCSKVWDLQALGHLEWISLKQQETFLLSHCNSRLKIDESDPRIQKLLKEIQEYDPQLTIESDDQDPTNNRPSSHDFIFWIPWTYSFPSKIQDHQHDVELPLSPLSDVMCWARCYCIPGCAFSFYETCTGGLLTPIMDRMPISWVYQEQ